MTIAATLTLDTPTPADAAALDAMAEASWRDTFAHFYKPEDLNAFLDENFGEDGRLRRDLANPLMSWQVARIDGAIARLTGLEILRKSRDDEDSYTISPVITAIMTASVITVIRAVSLPPTPSLTSTTKLSSPVKFASGV